MIDEQIMKQVLPSLDIDALKDDKITELKNEGFVITNWSSGGIFYHLLMIVLKMRVEVRELARTILNNMFVSHASGVWVELKAADYSKKLKFALKTQGLVTIGRAAAGPAITIAKGLVFKTDKDINGDELRFFVLSDTILQLNALSVEVPIEAENEGARYNVAAGQITKSLTHIEGVDTITNAEGWITREGADFEDVESLRARTLNSWADLATQPIAEKLKNAAEAISGVLFTRVDDQHPRGQGTIDVIVTSTAGEATETLLSQVSTAVNQLKAPDDDILVKSSTTQTQNIAITATVKAGTNTDGLSERIQAITISTMKISKDRDLNELIHSDITTACRNALPILKNVKVTTPADDLVLDIDKVIIPGTVTVAIVEAQNV